MVKKIIFLVLFSSFYQMILKAQFEEKAIEMGVDHTYKLFNFIGGGVAIFDMNNDGWEDIFIVGGESTNNLYINQESSFQRVIAYLSVEDIEYYNWVTTGVAAGDVNNDGWEDLFITTERDYPNYLMVNKGDGTFDVIAPEVSGIVDTARSISAAFGDINKDGWLDIVVANYIDTLRINFDHDPILYEHVGYKNTLLINKGDGTFLEMGEYEPFAKNGNSLAIACTDFDGDNDLDVYVANDFGAYTEPNELYENKFPQTTLEDISANSNANIGLFGMGIAIGDYDNDLDLDYYVTNLGKNELLANQGDKTFQIKTVESGLEDSHFGEGLSVGWGTGFLDYDNDGWLDVYISNGYIPADESIFNQVDIPNSLYKNRGDGSFENVSINSGLIDDASGRGSAYADFNNDGLLDIIIVPVDRQGVGSSIETRKEVELYMNVTSSTNNWVSFNLTGVTSNTSAIGASILLYDNQQNVQLREVSSGGSFASSNSKIVHFGLGSTSKIDSVVITWPSGIVSVIEDVSVNQIHDVREDEIALSNQSILLEESFQYYPNPTTDKIFVSISDDFQFSRPAEFLLINELGQAVRIGNVKQGKNEIELKNIASGNYFLLFKSEKHQITIGNIVVQ